MHLAGFRVAGSQPRPAQPLSRSSRPCRFQPPPVPPLTASPRPAAPALIQTRSSHPHPGPPLPPSSRPAVPDPPLLPSSGPPLPHPHFGPPLPASFKFLIGKTADVISLNRRDHLVSLTHVSQIFRRCAERAAQPGGFKIPNSEL